MKTVQSIKEEIIGHRLKAQREASLAYEKQELADLFDKHYPKRDKNNI